MSSTRSGYPSKTMEREISTDVRASVRERNPAHRSDRSSVRRRATASRQAGQVEPKTGVVHDTVKAHPHFFRVHPRGKISTGTSSHASLTQDRSGRRWVFRIVGVSRPRGEAAMARGERRRNGTCYSNAAVNTRSGQWPGRIPGKGLKPGRRSAQSSAAQTRAAILCWISLAPTKHRRSAGQRRVDRTCTSTTALRGRANRGVGQVGNGRQRRFGKPFPRCR